MLVSRLSSCRMIPQPVGKKDLFIPCTRHIQWLSMKLLQIAAASKVSIRQILSLCLTKTVKTWEPSDTLALDSAPHLRFGLSGWLGVGYKCKYCTVLYCIKHKVNKMYLVSMATLYHLSLVSLFASPSSWTCLKANVIVTRNAKKATKKASKMSQMWITFPHNCKAWPIYSRVHSCSHGILTWKTRTDSHSHGYGSLMVTGSQSAHAAPSWFSYDF